jgi:hypothetical protein
MRNFYRKGDCTECEKPETTIAKRIGPKLFCVWCNEKRKKDAKKPKQPTGEAKLFDKIWKEREHICAITGERLEFTPYTHLWFQCFSHLLPKGSWPKYRLNKENIVLKSPKAHRDYHTMSEVQLIESKHGDKWRAVFELKQRLKSEYNK